MKLCSSLFLCCSLLGVMSAMGQTNAEKAREKVAEAVKIMDSGKPAASIPVLEEAQKLDPDNIDIPYEIAYATYMMEDYKGARDMLKKLTRRDGAGPNVYQLLGNSYDLLEEPKKAISTYDDGLKLFPEAGNLYLERGVMEMKTKDYEKALQFFEKGIEMAPMFASNYYWAARIFCTSTQVEVWGMMYGEIFMNLERNTARTAHISKLLFDTYKSEITFPNDTSVSVSFCKKTSVTISLSANASPEELAKQLSNIKLPFGTTMYEPALSVAMVGDRTIDLASLNRIRTRFLDVYEQMGFQKKAPVVLFDFQREAREAGHLEAYNYWILSEGDKVAFNHWKLANDDKWIRFVDWFGEHQIQITADNKFNMAKY